ncbi:hypothetical protein AAG570_005232, partial [Ranatra chinensis]
ALNDEITNAYRRLSRLYHPDKHVDPARKKEAEIMFNKTKKAYEVLRDPHKRAIYDSVGVRGLETEGWEIMQRTKTPQEIREEYDRLARIREERRLQQRTNPKGNVTVNINATDLFSSYFYDDYDLGDNFPIIEISGMSLMQSIESPLTSRDTATMSGHLSTHNGTGTGGVTVSNKRTLSEKGWVEVLAGAGNGPLLGLKGFRTLTKRIFTTAETHLQFAPNGIRTSIDTTVAMQLDRHTMGYLSWRGGSSSGMSTTVARDTEKGHITGTVLLGVPHSYISLAYTWKLKEREIKIKAAVKAGTFGAALEYAAEKKVSEHSTISALVSVGVPTGVILKIKFVRANQTYNFPIHLCEEVMPSPVFYATVTPLVVWAVVKRLIIDPIVLERTERGRQRQKDNYKNRMAEKRREAQAATNLMSVTFARIRSEEEARRGLVIVSAVYGKLGSSGEGSAANQQQQDEIVDVTIPLQCLVKDSKLVIYESTKSQLPGFYDPCVGEEKFLCVQYLFHNQLHQTTVGDTEPLRIPRQCKNPLTSNS